MVRWQRNPHIKLLGDRLIPDGEIRPGVRAAEKTEIDARILRSEIASGTTVTTPGRGKHPQKGRKFTRNRSATQAPGRQRRVNTQGPQSGLQVVHTGRTYALRIGGIDAGEVCATDAMIALSALSATGRRRAPRALLGGRAAGDDVSELAGGGHLALGVQSLALVSRKVLDHPEQYLTRGADVFIGGAAHADLVDLDR